MHVIALVAVVAVAGGFPAVATPYSAATSVAVAELQRRGLHRVAAHVCWGDAAEGQLVRTLSGAGLAVNLFRGGEHTRAAVVDALLRDGAGQTAILVDMACPAAARLLVMASRLRLFDSANYWFLFENGRLEVAASASDEEAPPPGDNLDVEFPDAELVVTGRYGAQNRADALLPDEKVLLEVVPPVPRPRPPEEPRIISQVSLLSRAVLDVLESLLVLSDSEVLVVQAARPAANATLPDGEGAALNSTGGVLRDGQDSPRHLQGFVVFRSSMARSLQAYLVAEGTVDAANGTSWAWTLPREEERAIIRRRADLENATLRAPIIINFPMQYTFIEDFRERKRDYRPKTNFPVVKNMAEQVNAHLLVFERTDYGYNKDADGMFDGLMGELQRFECDLLSTAVYVTDERLYILDSVAETFPLRTGVVYRLSSSSRSAANLYLQPFSSGVWLAVVAMMAACVGQLIATTRSWTRPPPPPGSAAVAAAPLSVADCITAVLGALCQQGADRSPESVSGRAVVVLMLFASFFLFTSFSAFIVALLQAPGTPLRSPRELLASPMKIGAMDVAFVHAWFRGEATKAVRGVVGDIFVKKIKVHERPGFLPVWEGIENVRRGDYGYQAEMNEAYHEIQEKFTEAEKCDLFEMELFPSEAQIIVTVEKSPYREVFSRFVRWQRELGHLDRIAKRWYASKPRCEPGSRGFMAIGVREVIPLLLLLSYGILASLVCLAVEVLSARYRLARPDWRRWRWRWRRRPGPARRPPPPPRYPRPLYEESSRVAWPNVRPRGGGEGGGGVIRHRDNHRWQARGLAVGRVAARLQHQQSWRS